MLWEVAVSLMVYATWSINLPSSMRLESMLSERSVMRGSQSLIASSSAFRMRAMFTLLMGWNLYYSRLQP